jgi:pantothenate kinase
MVFIQRKTTFLIILLEFDSFPIASFSELEDQVRSLNLFSDSTGISGGGSVRYAEELALLFPKAKFYDEIECLVQGLLGEASCTGSLILANIGTGVSFIKIDGQSGAFSRIGGTNLGGSVIRGLSNWHSLDFPVSKEDGMHQRVDTLVSDIYGSEYGPAKLGGDCVAGSLGKLSSQSSDSDAIDGFLFMIASNLAHLLSLYAQIYGVKEIILSGSLAGVPAFQAAFKASMKYYNAKGEFFFRFHSNPAFLGCLGILQKLDNKD